VSGRNHTTQLDLICGNRHRGTVSIMVEVGVRTPPRHANLSLDQYSAHHKYEHIFLGRSASQAIPRTLCNQNVHRRVHNSPPPVSTLSEMNSIHTSQHFPHQTSWSSVNTPVCIVFGISCVKIPAWRLAILTENILGFSQSLQANSGIVP
jgi:hypothetical protein